MKKIKNPYSKLEGYNCFGCSPNNQFGLQMEFYEEDDYIISNWEPKTYLSGYGNILHGGIQSTILDEISSWVVFVKAKTVGFTATLNVKYKNTVYTDKGPLRVRAKLIDQNRRFATIHAEILNAEGIICSVAEAKYFIFPQDVAKQKFHYPGIEGFVDK
ncbi:MAG: PaaI family thioesterase [Bacteroidales bacterium]|jgi:acyl-coenzyme A thioesterase PaaI-like protein|nr:PaaI family thioesterase [Bacteroidales bacterium]